MLGDALADFGQKIKKLTGAPVELDSRDINLPGVILSPQKMEFDRLDSQTCTITVEVWIIAGYEATQSTLNNIGEIAHKLSALIEEFTPTTINLPSISADNLPALLGQTQIIAIMEKE